MKCSGTLFWLDALCFADVNPKEYVLACWQFIVRTYDIFTAWWCFLHAPKSIYCRSQNVLLNNNLNADCQFKWCLIEVPSANKHKKCNKKNENVNECKFESTLAVNAVWIFKPFQFALQSQYFVTCFDTLHKRKAVYLPQFGTGNRRITLL